jgi:hypothetical protein
MNLNKVHTYNPFVCDPGEFKIDANYPGLIRKKGSVDAAKFFMIGLVQIVDSSKNGTTVNVAPEFVTWARTIAFFGKLVEHKYVYVSSFKHGIAISTRRSNPNNVKSVSNTFNFRDSGAVLNPDAKGDLTIYLTFLQCPSMMVGSRFLNATFSSNSQR